MKLKDFIKWYEQLVPLELQEDFDNCGIQYGNLVSNISKILISLDLDESCIKKAISGRYDLIFTHHPPLFNPLKNIIEKANGVNTRLVKAIKEGINVYSSHTNLDCVEFGVSKALSDNLGLLNVENLRDVNDNNDGFGKIGIIEDTNSYDFINLLKQRLELNNVIVYGKLNKKIKRVAVLGGSGGHFINDCINKKCDVFISSEFKYDQQIDAIDNGLILIDIGHYESEKFILEYLKDTIKQRFPKLTVDVNLLDYPTRKIF